MNNKSKLKVVSLRMSNTQLALIEKILLEFKQTTGVTLTRTSLILKLIELGYEKFQKKYNLTNIQKSA